MSRRCRRWHGGYHVVTVFYEGTFTGATTLKVRAKTPAGTVGLNQGPTLPSTLVVDEVAP